MIKKILLFLITFILTKSSFPQTLPPTPIACTVTIDTNLNKPRLFWTIDDTSQIDGFIIKRIIWNGDGVVDGTLNNIAQLPDPGLNGFLDTTTTYNTEAKPWLRQEIYVITSYKTVGDNVVYSNFSQYLKTLFLTAQYDSCKQTITLRWKPQQPGDTVKLWLIEPQKKLLTITNDTFFIFKPRTNNKFSFIITKNPVNQCNIDSINSNLINITVTSNQRPNQLYISTIKANFPNSLQIFLKISLPQDKPTVKLFKNDYPIATFTGDFDGLVTDTNPQNQQNIYKLISFSRCDSAFDTSNIARNMVLTAKYLDKPTEKATLLQWTSYNYWLGHTQYYIIYFSTDGQNFSQLATTTDTFYIHDLKPLINRQKLPSQLYYYIAAHETQNPLNNNQIATSNIAVTTPPPLIFVPNTVLPLSSNPQDRVFKIYANFLDNFNLKIYDRNGRLLFSTNTPDNCWQATDQHGRLVPQGTYIYVITYQSQGKTYHLKGAVTVIY